MTKTIIPIQSAGVDLIANSTGWNRYLKLPTEDVIFLLPGAGHLGRAVPELHFWG